MGPEHHILLCLAASDGLFSPVTQLSLREAEQKFISAGQVRISHCTLLAYNQPPYKFWRTKYCSGVQFLVVCGTWQSGSLGGPSVSQGLPPG